MLLLAAAGTAGAQSGVDAAVDALKSDPVYVDPDAELADQVDADALRARITSAGAAPMFIAVLPAERVERQRRPDADRAAPGRRHRTGTYALALGDEFRTLSTTSTPPAPATPPAPRTRTTSRRR